MVVQAEELREEHPWISLSWERTEEVVVVADRAVVVQQLVAREVQIAQVGFSEISQHHPSALLHLNWSLDCEISRHLCA